MKTRIVFLKVLGLLALSVALLAVGCSRQPAASQPSEAEVVSQAREALQNLISEDMVELISVRKTGGQLLNNNEYVADIQFELRFKVSLDYLYTLALEEAGDDPEEIQQVNFAREAMRMAYGEFHAGETFVSQDEALFVRTEQGWKMVLE